MRKPYLIIDCIFLCYRAFYALGGLSHMDKGTGVIFGFLKELLSLQDFFDSDNFLFCWDSKRSIRRKMMRSYKSQRRRSRNMEKSAHESTHEKGELYYWEEIARQAIKLRKHILPTIGYRNSFIQSGYEADDLIALCAAKMRGSRFGYIVTADHDMYQCLSNNVSIYNPSIRDKNKIMSLSTFTDKFDILPPDWALVKALAGCLSDSVKGIKGVGEITALQYINGDLPIKYKTYTAITSSEGQEILKRNYDIVQLPLEGVNPIRFVSNEISDEGWKQVTDELGMGSIRERSPVKRTKKKKERKQASLFDA